MHTANSPLKECITHTDRIVLNYDESNLSFDVALLSYSTAEANQYYYRMDPIDKGWIKAATNQNISYAKLPPGQYTFKVKATSNDDGQFVERSLFIEILPSLVVLPLGICLLFYLARLHSGIGSLV